MAKSSQMLHGLSKPENAHSDAKSRGIRFDEEVHISLRCHFLFCLLPILPCSTAIRNGQGLKQNYNINHLKMSVKENKREH